MKKRLLFVLLVSFSLVALMQRHALARIAPIGEKIEKLDKSAADVIVVGNSMQGKGIDFPSLSKQTGVKVESYGFGGAMSVWKHCVVKYVIPKLHKKPKVVVVVTRMNYITCPQRRATEYRSRSRKMVQLAGRDAEDWGLLQGLSIKGDGQPKWDRQWNKDEPPPKSYWWDFPKAVKTSILPLTIEAAGKNGFHLVIARHKSRKDAETPDWATAEVKKYEEDLASYLHKNGAIFLDYSHRPELKKEHYSRGDHLNEAGRVIWTRLMADDLRAILKGKIAPNQRLPRTVKPRKNNPTPTSKPAL